MCAVLHYEVTGLSLDLTTSDYFSFRGNPGRGHLREVKETIECNDWEKGRLEVNSNVNFVVLIEGTFFEILSFEMF